MTERPALAAALRNAPAEAAMAERRARMLAEPSRRRVWQAVRNAQRPIGVAELARTLSIHPNTVRLHLSRLVESGLVDEHVETAHHPGRPGYRYRAGAADPVSDGLAYRRLSQLLAQAVRTRIGARHAGRAAGAASASRRAGVDPIGAIVAFLAEGGFVPEAVPAAPGRVDIILHACPFAEAAAEDPATICQLHLGLAEGAAEAIGGLAVEDLTIADPHRAGCRVNLSSRRQPRRHG